MRNFETGEEIQPKPRPENSKFDNAAAITPPSKFAVETAKTPGLDISGEAYRTYTFANGEITVYEPALLWVKRGEKGDSHRIALANGNGVYIPAGWLKIEWANKPGQPPVSF